MGVNPRFLLAMVRRAEGMATGGVDPTTCSCSTTYGASVEVASRLRRSEARWAMREIETWLQPFGEFLLRARLGARGETPRCTETGDAPRPARRDEGANWAFVTEEQRSPGGMQRPSNAAGLSPRAPST